MISTRGFVIGIGQQQEKIKKKIKTFFLLFKDKFGLNKDPQISHYLFTSVIILKGSNN